jgi:threonine synthase
MIEIVTTFSHLECGVCGRQYDRTLARAFCGCGGEMLARYDLDSIKDTRDSIDQGAPDMWRYAALLPANPASILSMGEGWTPLVRATRTGARLNIPELWIKDESCNPTGSWEARGYACTVSVLRGLGERVVPAVTGNDAASACAAYSAAAGLEAKVHLSASATLAQHLECHAFGAEIGGLLAEHDPYRLEGLKTAGYEIAEQLGWAPPSAILCPDAAAARALGKAFDELRQLGWIGDAPVALLTPPPTIGRAGAIDAALAFAASEGILPSPAAGACLAAIPELIREGSLGTGAIVVLNPSAGLKCAEAYATRFPRLTMSESAKLGGLITPR